MIFIRLIIILYKLEKLEIGIAVGSTRYPMQHFRTRRRSLMSVLHKFVPGVATVARPRDKRIG